VALFALAAFFLLLAGLPVLAGLTQAQAVALYRTPWQS